MKTPNEEKPLFNIRIQRELKLTKKTELLELLSFGEIELRAYVKELFKKNGELYTSRIGKHLLILEEEDPYRLNIYQTVLEKLDIESIIIEPMLANNKFKLLIIHPKSLVNFRERIGEDLFEKNESVHDYYFKLDWED